MKKSIRFSILTFIFILSLSVVVSASSNTYKLSELGVDITIPDGYKVITRTTPENAAVFSELGRTKSDVIEQFQASNIYLDAISDTYNEEVVVTMSTNIIDNFSALSDTSLKLLASSLVNEYEKMGIRVLKYDIYQHSQAKFVRIYFEDTVNSANNLQYYTIYNKKAMNFTMRSYSGGITTKQEQTIKNIVDSAKYDTPPVESPVGEETERFVYTDIDTNTKFTVPANWCEEPLFKEREFVDVKFGSSKDEGISIMYGSTDLWKMLTPEERKGNSRSDLDSSFFEISDIATMYGIDENLITKQMYNGKEHFQATVKQNNELYGAMFTSEITMVVRIENGWGYMFSFGGTTDNEYFADFQELLNSVEYPYYQKEISTTGFKTAVFFLVTFIAAGILFYIFIERRIHQSEEMKVIATENSNGICSHCGAQLAEDVSFCHKCGKKLSTTVDSESNL